MKVKRKMVQISFETYDGLSQIGKFGESMNDVIQRLLQFYNSNNKPKK